MESDEEEPHRKRPLLNNNHSSMARSTYSPPNDDGKPADVALLQGENQKLVYQLDRQKQELNDLELKIKELKHKQVVYDETLMKVNLLWNQLVDDTILLALQAGSQSAFQCLEGLDASRDTIPPCSAEDMFLHRLLKLNAIEGNEDCGSIGFVKEALTARQASTKGLMNLLEDAIATQRTQFEEIAQILMRKLSVEDTIMQLHRLDDLMLAEANRLQEVVDVIQCKHRQYANEIQCRMDSHSVDLLEKKRLTGEFEECMADLEESRRKLISLKMQKDGMPGMHVPVPVPVIVPHLLNGTLSPVKPTDKSKHLQELKESIEEVKVLADDRLSEVQDAQEDNSTLLKQLHDLQNELEEDRYIYTSRPYSLLNDQLLHWNAEADRYRKLADSLQAERHFIVRREKELMGRADAMDSETNAIDSSETKFEELQNQLELCVIEKNEMEINLEEAMEESGREEIKEEFEVMESALSKEMVMMEKQLQKWKTPAEEAISLHEKAQSLSALIDTKNSELKMAADKLTQRMVETKSLKEITEKMQNGNRELEIFLDMLGLQIHDNRVLSEIRGSEQKAETQAKSLKNVFDEHSLELRVKAAYEAEAACKQRLSVAEAEITELKAELFSSSRDVLVIKEAIKTKDVEAEAYISEIETIGQAYEDMQTQNQHLVQHLAERDEYNIKLVSDSVKAKQSESLLLSGKQVLAQQLEQLNGSLESLKSRIAHSEEQMKLHHLEALSSIKADRRMSLALEFARWELADTEKELKMLKLTVSSTEKEEEQIQKKLDDIQIDLYNERNERKNIDEELVELNRTVDELITANSEPAMQKLQQEIKDCKAILKCSVCFDRPKEVVIVKCFHLFCNQCIQRNLEIRHRKCPGCGTAFGQNDIRFVKI